MTRMNASDCERLVCLCRRIACNRVYMGGPWPHTTHRQQCMCMHGIVVISSWIMDCVVVGFSDDRRAHCFDAIRVRAWTVAWRGLLYVLINYFQSANRNAPLCIWHNRRACGPICKTQHTRTQRWRQSNSNTRATMCDLNLWSSTTTTTQRTMIVCDISACARMRMSIWTKMDRILISGHHAGTPTVDRKD